MLHKLLLPIESPPYPVNPISQFLTIKP